MLRFINICLLLGLVALAYVIYDVKYQARGLDQDIVALNSQIDDQRDSIAVLRAEWSLLNRPERIERLAEKYLDLQSPNPDQIIMLDSTTQSEFDRKFAALAAAQPHPDVPAFVKLLQSPAE
jgi:cell division protein FtsL